MKEALPIWLYIATEHKHNITHAAAALGVDRSTLHRVMNSAYVIDGGLYTKARASK